MDMNPDKHDACGHSNVHLGVANDLSALSDDILKFLPKPGRIKKTLAKFESIRGAKCLPSGEAACLRGELNYLFCTSFNKVGRFALRPLADRQYGKDSGPWSSTLEGSIDF